MTDEKMFQSNANKALDSNDSKKGPVSFLIGSLTSALFSWFGLKISKSLIMYFTLHQQNYTNSISQNIATSFKTLLIGMSFLATFSFSFIALGLFIVFLRSFFTKIKN